MLHEVWVLASEPTTHSGSGLGLNLGTLLSGVAAIILALGSAVGSFVRYRKAVKQIKVEASQNSIKSSQESADRLSEQYEARLAQNETTIAHLNRANDDQRHLYEERLANQQALINTLLAQILKHLK